MSFGANTEFRWLTPSARLAKGSGSANIISLSAIRNEAGPRWDAMREEICARLETMFRQRLAPSDFFVPLDQVSYLVVMPAATPEEGQICCLRISYELHVGLLGCCGIEHLEVSRAESVSDDALELYPLSRFEIVRLAEKADFILAPPGSGHLNTDPCQPSQPEAPPEIEIKFLPVWDAQYQVIRAYRCLYDGPSFGAAAPTLQEEARELAQITTNALTRAAGVLQSHLAHNERFIVNLPISYGALTSPLARMEFIAACRRLPCELRPYLMFKIEGLPNGAPHSRMIDLVATLNPFCRGVIARAPRSEHALDIYRGVGLKALGIGVQSTKLSQTAAAIERLCSAARRERLHAFLDDVPDAATLRFAVKAGVQWISGVPVIPPVAEPGPLMRLTLDNLINEAVA